MKHFEKIHQHIDKTLEDRGLHKSLSDIFNKHRILSFKCWRIFSLFAFFPISLQSVDSVKFLTDSLIINSSHVPSLPEHLLLFFLSISAFLFPIALGAALLNEVLPLYKLSQKPFFKKHFEKYLRKSTTLASSCDLVNYKADMISQFSQDKELNLAMSSYYQYLLEFPFPTEIKKNIIAKRDKLLDIELDNNTYQKNFVNTVLRFISDFNYYSTCPIIIKNCYEKEIVDYTDTMLSKTDSQEEALHSELSQPLFNNTKEKQKKLFKDML